jgi:hypothetical protein
MAIEQAGKSCYPAVVGPACAMFGVGLALFFASQGSVGSWSTHFQLDLTALFWT